MPKWKFALSLLLAFLMGWQFAPQFAATGWYRPVTSILIALAALVMLVWALRQLSQENKKSSKNLPKSRQDSM